MEPFTYKYSLKIDNLALQCTYYYIQNMNLKQTMMNDHDKLIQQNGEKGQGDYLLKAKKKI